MDFKLEEEQTEEFSLDFPTQENFTPSTINFKEAAKLHSYTMNEDFDLSLSKYENGMGPMMETEQSHVVRTNEEEFIRKEIDNKLSTNASIEDIQNLIDNSFFGGMITSPAEAILAGNTQFAREERRALRRSAMITQLANKYLKQQNEGLVDTVLEVGDQVLSQGVGELFYGLTSDRNEAAKLFSSLLFSDKPDEVVMEEAEAIFEEMGDQGFFTQENSIYLSMFITQMLEGGVGPAAFEEKVFAGIDAAGAVAGVAPSLVHGIKALTAANKIHKLSNAQAGVDIAVDNVQRGIDSVKALEEAVPTVAKPGRINEADKASLNLEVAEQVRGENELLDFILKDNGFIGIITDEEVLALSPQIRETFKNNMSKGQRKRLLDIEIERDGLSNRTVHGYLGRPDGKLFKPNSKAAKKLAESLGGEVIEHQLKGGETGSVVKVSKRLKQNKLVPATPLDEIDDSLFSSIKSTTSRTAVKLDSLLKANESQSSRAFKAAEDLYNKSARAVGKKEVFRVDQIMQELNDNPALFDRTEPYTTAEFRVKYQQQFKTAPSDKVVQYYNDQVKLNDATWLLRADAILKRAIENGEALYKIDSTFYRAKQVDRVEGKVYDLKAGEYKNADQFQPGTILEVAGDLQDQFGKPVRYVFQPSLVSKPLKHKDVLGYNPGGSRVYEDAKFFVKQEKEMFYGDGTSLRSSPKTFMATVTETEARKAVSQINNLVEFISKKFKDLNADDLVDAKNSLLEDEEFLDLFEKNSDWYLGMEPEDLFTFADEWGIDLTKKVDFAPDGEEILSARSAGANTVGENFLVNTSKSRTLKPLVGFGGNPASVLTPSRATEFTFTIALNKAANDAYIRRATNGWLKAATEGGFIKNLDQLTGSPIENMRNAEVSNSLKGGSKLEAERSLIESKIQYKTKDVIKIEQLTNRLADFVYDKGAKTISKGLKDPNPVGFLRSLAFHTKLGLFALDQIMVQASQLVNIIGISAKNGLRGTLIVPQIRAALIAPNNSIVKEISKRSSVVSGVKPEDFENIVKMIRLSGRDLVDQNIIELDGNQLAMNNIGKRLLDAGRIPFNEGELLARIGAMSTAYLDTKLKYPDLDLFSEEGRLLISRRQDILTASMTSASSAPWQRSTLAVPTQFITYSVRMAEQMLSGQILTKGERARLALTQAAFWGGSGIVPLSYFTEGITFQKENNIDPEIYKLVRYGLIDYGLSTAFDTETDLSSRLGASGGVTGLIDDIMSSTPYEVALGPSGEIALTSADMAFSLGYNMFSGNWNYIKDDMSRLSKTVTSLSRAQAAYLAYSRGVMVNRKTNEKILDNLSQDDALMIAFGIPLKEQTLAFELYQNDVAHKEYIQKISDDMFRMRSVMFQKMDEGDDQAAKEISDDIAMLYNSLLPYDQNEVKRSLSRPDDDFFESMLRRQLEKGNTNSIMMELGKNIRE